MADNGVGCSFDKYMADNRNGSKSVRIKGRDHLTATKRIIAYTQTQATSQGYKEWHSGAFLFIFSQLTLLLQDKRLPSSGSRPDETILRPFVLTETRCESCRGDFHCELWSSLLKDPSVESSAPWGPTRFL